jgi:hypothetical protein
VLKNMSEQLTAQTQTATKPTFTPLTTGVLRRQCACGQHTSAGSECEECKQKREGILQRAAINPSPVHDVPPIVHEVPRSPGQPLNAATRAFMEPHFGYDFSRLPVHASELRTVQAPKPGSRARNKHAHEADSITYYTAGKLSAPLIAEGPWEGICGNGGPGAKLDAGVGGSGSGAAATLPKLTKKTVTPLTKGDCGKSDWIVQWELDKKTTNGGWIVQKVELPYDVKDCSDKAVDPTKRNGPQPRKFPFWEAWQIHKNQQVTTFAEGGDVNDDDFELVSPGSDTKGSITVQGTVEFYEGLTLPGSFRVTNQPPAYSLPSTKSAPTLSGGTGAISHTLKATWDCCSKDKTATKKTTADII